MWGEEFLEGVEPWEEGLELFATNYATTEPPKYATAGGVLSPVHSGFMINSERAMQMSYDYKSGSVNIENPSLHVICCSLADPSRAPAGIHTVKIFAYQPSQFRKAAETHDSIKQQDTHTT